MSAIERCIDNAYLNSYGEVEQPQMREDARTELSRLRGAEELVELLVQTGYVSNFSRRMYSDINGYWFVMEDAEDTREVYHGNSLRDALQALRGEQ
jgi:hypothetical protein